jgi:hypothetical protein
MIKKNALGKGLGALIEGVEKEALERKVEPTWTYLSIDRRKSLSAQNPF